MKDHGTTTFVKTSAGLCILLLVMLAVPKSTTAACVYLGNYYSEDDCIRLGIKNGLYSSTQPQIQVQTQTQSQVRAQLTIAEITRLEAQVRQLLALLEQLKLRASQSNYYYYPTLPISSGSLITVSTGSVAEVEDDRATLKGRVDFGSSDEATVYFRYGYYSTDLNRETTHLVLDDSDDEDFSQRIIYLKRDTEYFYQAIAEDEDGRKAYGSIRSFSTDDRTSSSGGDDEPEVDTDSAEDITNDSAELHGSVDMNDFNNGRIFFVWGEDEDQIDAVADDYDTYSDVDEDGDDLQKQQVDSGLDDSADYTLDVSGLADDTDIYFSICVEYEDDDDDEVLICGATEDFTTDN